MTNNTSTNDNEKTINFDTLSKNIKNDNGNESFQQGQSNIIGQINIDKKTYIDADLRNNGNNININKGYENKSKTYNILLSFLIILTGIISFLFMKYDQYIIDYGNGIENTENTIAKQYEKAKKQIYKLIGKEYVEQETTINISDDNGKTNLSNLIQNDSSYIYKKETIKNSIRDLINSIISNTNNVNEAKKHISTYGFFVQNLSNIISDNENISLIQDSLSSIQSIKFSSAISVFSNLETFLESLSKETELSKEEILVNIKEILARGEKDINLYIKNCYLNAAEITYNCNNIGDFDRYYKLTEETGFNTTFFKRLIQFVDSKLEQTEIPSFSIKFKSFNKDLTFDIEINTFKEDEIELAKKGILSPHSFILNNLINNLKLSRVIVSEPIEVKSIDINQRNIVVGSTEFIVNTSSKTFTVPIKKENQIEIDDFVY